MFAQLCVFFSIFWWKFWVVSLNKNSTKQCKNNFHLKLVWSKQLYDRKKLRNLNCNYHLRATKKKSYVCKEPQTFNKPMLKSFLPLVTLFKNICITLRHMSVYMTETFSFVWKLYKSFLHIYLHAVKTHETLKLTWAKIIWWPAVFFEKIAQEVTDFVVWT